MKKDKAQSSFDKLFQEAFNGDIFDNDIESDDSMEFSDDEAGLEDEMDTEITITLKQDQVNVLRDIMAQLDGDDKTEDEVDAEDVEDVEEMETEAVEMEKAPDAETVKNQTKSHMKIGKQNAGAELEGAAQNKKPKEGPFKFVKIEKPKDLNIKTTEGS